MSGDEGEGGAAGAREQDRFLPIANIARIMKKTLPGNAKIAKDAKETVQECVSEFISFITSEASDKCLKEKRKTINGDDLLCAMSTLGFEEYIEPLKLYLAKFREAEVLQGKDVKKEGGHGTPRGQTAQQVAAAQQQAAAAQAAQQAAQLQQQQAQLQQQQHMQQMAGFAQGMVPPGMVMPPGMMPGYPPAQPPGK